MSLAQDTSHERTLWHPVAAQAELGSAPLALTLLDQRLVLWLDGAGLAHAFADRCPHRGTPLSMGHVREGRLECAYHGWQFEGGGACAHIPAVPDFVPSPTHAACAYSVCAEHGLWWVRLAAGAVAGPPTPAGLPTRQVVCGPYDVATSAPRVVENFLDTSHFGFVHEGWLGDCAHTTVPTYEVVTGPGGAPCVPHYRAWQPQANAQAREGAWVDYCYEVLSPYSALLTKQVAGAAAAVQEAYALWVCPVGPESSRVWFTLHTLDTTSSDDSLRAFQHTIFTQDQPVLEAQRPRRLPVSGGEVHCAADRLSAAYRRYLVAQGITFGVC
jgi:phenylpropionate dioxygenase-like ring-hydroxylating dioxygenase large terminal subunit